MVEILEKLFINRLVGLSLVLLVSVGCQKERFNIHKELELQYSEVQKSNYKLFLQDLEVRGVSYSDDKLTPDLIDGQLFEDRNLSKVEITHYFIYSDNITLEHTSSIFSTLSPNMVRYLRGYINEDARVTQIKSYKPPVIKRPKRRVVAKRRNPNDFLPKGLLPPRLPDLSIGVDTPNVPGI